MNRHYFEMALGAVICASVWLMVSACAGTISMSDNQIEWNVHSIDNSTLLKD